MRTQPSADRLRDIHEQLQQGVHALTTSEDWLRALAFAGRFYSYSFGNTLLISAQRPDATWVAGFQRWRELGRYVRRGERGIAILAPVVVGRRHDAETDEPERVVRFFKVAHVFDVAQTDGNELPRTVFADRLTSGDERERDLYTGLADSMRSDGWRVESVPPSTLAIHGRETNGVTVYSARSVQVRDDLSPAQAFKTLAHERAHTLLHDGTTAARELIECEAESAAYVVLTALGIDAGAYSFGYVAGWSKGDAKIVQAAGRNALCAAQRILAGLEVAE
jgi:antirestriction factor ArdC-like protein